MKNNFPPKWQKISLYLRGKIIFDGTPNELNTIKDKYIKYFILGKDIN
mgnify:CR=1 FL=1